MLIINNTSLGNKEKFSFEQILFFNTVIECADELFDVYSPESMRFNLRAMETPIYLIPYETYIVYVRGRCVSSFAKKMRGKYEEEKNAIPDNCPPQERERRLKKLSKKYGPWLCFHSPSSCAGCYDMWSSPLGYFVPDDDGGKIYVCLDKIIERYPGNVNEVAALVILHELGHARMHNPAHSCYQTLFDYWAEESLANKIALSYLAIASKCLGEPKLIKIARDFVEKQKDAYKLGYYLFEHNALDWATLRENKPDINESRGDRWVDVVCEDMIDFKEAQKLFFCSFGNPKAHLLAGFDSWLNTTAVSSKGRPLDIGTAKRYSAAITSHYFGLAFREMMGWSYGTLSDCLSSREVEQLIKILEVKGSEENKFHIGAYTGLIPAIKYYHDYLISMKL